MKNFPNMKPLKKQQKNKNIKCVTLFIYLYNLKFKKKRNNLAHLA